MITFNYKTKLTLNNDSKIETWLSGTIKAELFNEGAINYIFCDDAYLLNINLKYLKHNRLTDIISFDYTEGKEVSGDMYISVERVLENAVKYKVSTDKELHRVMIHGILHLCGYNDKTKEEKHLMREKEDYYLSLRTF